MKKFAWRRAAVAAIAVPMLALTACSSQGGRTPETGGNAAGGQVATTERMKIALITHAPQGTHSGTLSARVLKKPLPRTTLSSSTSTIRKLPGSHS